MKIGVLLKCVKKQNVNFDPDKRNCYEINKNDLFSLENALKMKEKTGAELYAISIGSQTVKPIIQKIYNFGVDKVILVSDTAIAGSDTYATATVIEAVVQKEKIDVLFVGKESSDSATGQIGPQLATLLGFDFASNVTKIESSPNKQEIICTTEENGRIITVQYPLPLVIVTAINANVLRVPTAADYFAAMKKEVQILNLNNYGVPPSKCGVKGSYTKVTNVCDAVVNGKNSVEIKTDCVEFINQKIDICKNLLDSDTETSDKSALIKHSTNDEILIISDASSYDLRSLKSVVSYFSTLKKVSVLLFDEDKSRLEELKRIGATTLYVSDVSSQSVDYINSGKRLAQIVERIGARYLLAISSPLTKVLAPIIATILKTGLTADCSEIYFEDGLMKMVRPTFGDSKYATIICHKTLPQFATIRANCFCCNCINVGEAEIINVDTQRTAFSNVKILNIENSDVLNWDKNVILVAGGGLTKESVAKLQTIAKKIGADFGATRVIVDKGFVPHKYQIGQTGVNIVHKLCVSFGVSGAIEHTVGIGKSTQIISINNDVNCPLNKLSDYHSVSDANIIINKLEVFYDGK